MSTQQQDSDGQWRQAIPLPREVLYWTWLGPRFGQRCGMCGVTFATEQAYRDHYRSDHPPVSS
jgi:hypothetical protein